MSRFIFVLAMLCAVPAQAGVEQETRLAFTMGQLTLFARQADTDITIINLADGAEYASFNLAGEGTRWERTAGVPNYVAVRSTKPVALRPGWRPGCRLDGAA